MLPAPMSASFYSWTSSSRERNWPPQAWTVHRAGLGLASSAPSDSPSTLSRLGLLGRSNRFQCPFESIIPSTGRGSKSIIFQAVC